ncbi:MAG: hypothetical protein AB8C84_12765 [Oligoflexales bacterium]
MRLFSVYVFSLLGWCALFLEPVQAKYLKVYTLDGRGGGEVHLSTLSQSLSKSPFLLSLKSKIKTDVFFVGHGSVVASGVLIKENVVINERVTVAEGAKIFSGVHLSNDVKIGESTVLHDEVFVGSASRVGRHVYVRSKTRIGNHVRILDRSKVDSLVTVRDGVVLENDTEIGYAADIGENVIIKEHSRVSIAQKVPAVRQEAFCRGRSLSKEVIKKLYMKNPPLPSVTACDLMFPKIPSGAIFFEGMSSQSR